MARVPVTSQRFMRSLLVAIGLTASRGIKLTLLPSPKSLAVSPGDSCNIALNSPRMTELLGEHQCVAQLLEPEADDVAPVLKVTALRHCGVPLAQVTCIGRCRMLRRWTTDDGIKCAEVEPIYDEVPSADEAASASLSVRMRYQACRDLALAAHFDLDDELDVGEVASLFEQPLEVLLKQRAANACEALQCTRSCQLQLHSLADEAQLQLLSHTLSHVLPARERADSIRGRNTCERLRHVEDVLRGHEQTLAAALR